MCIRDRSASALQSFTCVLASLCISQLWTSQALVAECSDIEKHKLFGVYGGVIFWRMRLGVCCIHPKLLCRWLKQLLCNHHSGFVHDCPNHLTGFNSWCSITWPSLLNLQQYQWSDCKPELVDQVAHWIWSQRVARWSSWDTQRRPRWRRPRRSSSRRNPLQQQETWWVRATVRTAAMMTTVVGYEGVDKNLIISFWQKYCDNLWYDSMMLYESNTYS